MQLGTILKTSENRDCKCEIIVVNTNKNTRQNLSCIKLLIHFWTCSLNKRPKRLSRYSVTEWCCMNVRGWVKKSSLWRYVERLRLNLVLIVGIRKTSSWEFSVRFRFDLTLVKIKYNGRSKVFTEVGQGTDYFTNIFSDALYIWVPLEVS